MPRFFIDDISGEELAVSGADARHMALALRMKKGEHVTLCDGKNGEAVCEIFSIAPEEVLARVLDRRPSGAEPSCRITLYQALPKSDKLEFIVQKAVELGVSAVVPVLSRNCVSRPDDRSMEKKLSRLKKIADEAAKQSGRGALPEIGRLTGFREAVAAMKNASLPLFFYEHGSASLKGAMASYSGGEVAIMIGAEGGFDEDEALFAREGGLAMLSLGPRILRCETAPIAAIAAVLYATGNME